MSWEGLRRGSRIETALMDPPTIVFALTAITVIISVVRVEMPYFAAVRKLQERSRSYGAKTPFFSDWKLQAQLRRDPQALLSDNDPAEIRKLKLELIAQRAAVRRAFPRLAVIFLSGLLLTLGAAMAQSVIEWLLQKRH